MVEKIEEDIEIDMDKVEEVETEQEMKVDDFEGNNYLKNPEVGESIVFTVSKIVNNKKTTGKNSEGTAFNIGIVDKNGKVKRIDIHSDKGVYTINTWEIYFKLFDARKESEGILIKYARENNKSFAGAKLKITRNHDGSHARMKISDLQKVKGFSTTEETVKYQEELKQIMKDRKLYTIELL